MFTKYVKFFSLTLLFILTIMPVIYIIRIVFADVAELADAHGSGPCECEFMQVQVLSSADGK